MADKTHTPIKPKQEDGDAVPKNSDCKASSKTPINSGKKDKKAGVSLTPVESLLFFNIVRFHQDHSNIDWVQVAKNSNLKNAGSAKVRFRQVQKKYGLEFNTSGRQMKRKTRASTADEDDDEDDDEEDSDESPSKKRFSKFSTHEHASQSRASRKKAIVPKGSDSGAFSAISSPLAKRVASTQQVGNGQQMQVHGELDIKQESPLRQLQEMEAIPASHISPSHQQPGRGPLAFPSSTNAPYDMGSLQHSGLGMYQDINQIQRRPSMSDSCHSKVFTPQQQAYLQNLQWLHHDRAIQRGDYQNPFARSQPQSHAYMNQSGGDLYGQFGGSPAYTLGPQTYHDIQSQANGNQLFYHVPTQAAAQSRATSVGDDDLNSYRGDGSFKSAPDSPNQSMFEEVAQVSDSATNPLDTAAKPASHSETN